VVDTVAADARPKNLVSRVVGVITAPRATYADVAARPRALGVLLVIIAITAAALGVFMSTEVGREAALDQQIRTMESFGIHANDTQYERMKEAVARPPVVAMIGQAVFLVAIAALVAGIALAVFNLMGGDGTFRQTFAVVAHSGVIVALQQLFVMPLNYARQSLSSPTNVGVFFPFLDENTFPARLLGGIDLFLVWWIVSLAIGLGVLYKRRTAPVAMTLLGVYVVLAVIVAAVKSALSGA
jgi:hypothetical protein